MPVAIAQVQADRVRYCSKQTSERETPHATAGLWYDQLPEPGPVNPDELTEVTTEPSGFTATLSLIRTF